MTQQEAEFIFHWWLAFGGLAVITFAAPAIIQFIAWFMTRRGE